MAVVATDQKAAMVIDLSGVKQYSYTIDPDASPDEIYACAQAINYFQVHPIKDVYRKMTVQLVNQ
ncbi:MAG: hypothetical protein LBT44_10145 [Clostridiales bacterium]|jgi:hypothetical protein|nr:hypothetical protein [Clostridiales bacterium]